MQLCLVFLYFLQGTASLLRCRQPGFSFYSSALWSWPFGEASCLSLLFDLEFRHGQESVIKNWGVSQSFPRNCDQESCMLSYFSLCCALLIGCSLCVDYLFALVFE